MQCEYFALEGLAKLLNTIKIVQQRLNNKPMRHPEKTAQVLLLKTAEKLFSHFCRDLELQTTKFAMLLEEMPQKQL